MFYQKTKGANYQAPARQRRFKLVNLTTVVAIILSLFLGLTNSQLTSAASNFNGSATALQIAQELTADMSLVTGASFVSKPVTGTPDGINSDAVQGFPLSGTKYGVLTTGAGAGPLTPP